MKSISKVQYATFHYFAEGDYKKGVFYSAVNILVNGYSILLQRYNRARIYNILDMLAKRAHRLE